MAGLDANGQVVAENITLYERVALDALPKADIPSKTNLIPTLSYLGHFGFAFFGTQVINNSGGTIKAGQPVKITGYDSTNKLFEVQKAASTDPSAPVGFFKVDVATATTGDIYRTATVVVQDTLSSAGATVYVGETAGSLTETAPTKLREAAYPVGVTVATGAGTSKVDFYLEGLRLTDFVQKSNAGIAGDGAFHELLGFDLAINGPWIIKAEVQGSAADSTKASYFEIAALFKRVAGTWTLLSSPGALKSFATESNGDSDCDLLVSANKVSLQVKSSAAKVWSAKITYRLGDVA